MQLQPAVGFLPAAIPGYLPRLETAGVTAVDLSLVAPLADDERAPALRPAALDQGDEIQVLSTWTTPPWTRAPRLPILQVRCSHTRSRNQSPTAPEGFGVDAPGPSLVSAHP